MRLMHWRNCRRSINCVVNLSAISAPAQNIAQVVAGGVRQIVNVLDAYAKKDESAEVEPA